MKKINKIRKRLADFLMPDIDRNYKLKIERNEPISFIFKGKELYMPPEIGSIYHLRHSTPKIERMVNFIGCDAKIILDVGAHSGIFSKLAAERSPTAKIFAFEPNEDLAKILRLNLSEEMRIVSSAVGATKGEIEIYVNRLASQSSSLLKASADTFAKKNPLECRTVSITSIDAFCKENEINEVDVIKVDVQGYELEVLKGAREILPTVKTLFLEASFLDIASIEAVFSMRERFPYAYAVNDVTLGADIAFCQSPVDTSSGSCFCRIW